MNQYDLKEKYDVVMSVVYGEEDALDNVIDYLGNLEERSPAKYEERVSQVGKKRVDNYLTELVNSGDEKEILEVGTRFLEDDIETEIEQGAYSYGNHPEEIKMDPCAAQNVEDIIENANNERKNNTQYLYTHIILTALWCWGRLYQGNLEKYV